MTWRIVFTMALFMMFAASAVFGQQGPDKIQQKVVQEKIVEAGLKTNANDLGRDKLEIIEEIRDARYRQTWLEYRQEKTRRYIAHAKQSIEDLEYKKEEFKKLQKELKSYLEEVILRLEDFIDQDLPFLPDERLKRIEGLKRSMDDLDLPLSKLLGQVFEVGLQIETEYGKVLDASEETTLKIEGVDTEIVILRLGRVGMYYMSLDEKKSGFYSRITGTWEPLPESMKQEIKRSLKIGRREQVAEIVNLPLGELEDVR
jgi:hypothetical protein